MKNILLSTITAIAIISNAFGAASVRRTTATSSKPTVGATGAIGSTARAGSLRTTKAISSSAPIATSTKTGSISQSTSTGTGARMSLLSGMTTNTPNMGQIKDTIAAQQELNNISSQIQELQSQLSDAQAAQSTLITSDNVGDIVADKIQTMGTYSKTEIDEMLRAITPTVDNNGYLNMTLTDGTSVRQSPYWLIGIAIDTYPHINTLYRYGTHGNISTLPVENWVNDEICPSTNSDNRIGCCGPLYDYIDDNTTFLVSYQYYGYDVGGTSIIYQNDGKIVRKQVVTTAVDNAEAYIQNEICGNTPSTECWIELDHSYDSGLGCARIYWFNVYTVIGKAYNLVSSGWFHGDLEYNEYYELSTPGSVTEIPSEWVDAICANYHSPSDFIRCYQLTTVSNNHNIEGFEVSKDYPGFYLDSVEAIDNGVKYNYITHQEELTREDLREHFCGDRPESSCYIPDLYPNYYGSWVGNTFWFRSFSVYIIDTNTLFGYFMTGFDDSDISKITHYVATSHPSSAMIQSWVNDICEATTTEQSTNMLGCCWLERSEPGSDSTYFGVHRMYHGYEVVSSNIISQQPTLLNHQHIMFQEQVVRTFENDSLNYIKRELCGDRPTTDCSVEYVSSHDTCDNRITEHRYKVKSKVLPPTSYENIGSESDDISTVTHYISGINPSNSAIQTWVNNICAATPASQATNMLGCCWQQCTSSGDDTCFDVLRMYKGYKIMGMSVVLRDGRLMFKYDIDMYEDDLREQIMQDLCSGHMGNDCIYGHVTGDETDTCDSNIKRWHYSLYVAADYELLVLSQEPSEDGLGSITRYRTNIPEDMVSLYKNYWCGNKADFWCKLSVENIPDSTDLLLTLRQRHNGVVCSPGSVSTLGQYQICTTNQDNTVVIVNSRICGNNSGTDTCWVTSVTDRFIEHPEYFDGSTSRFEASVFKKLIEEEKLPIRLEK